MPTLSDISGQEPPRPVGRTPERGAGRASARRGTGPGSVAAHLEPRRLLGTTVTVGTPYYQGVSVAALVQALPGRPATIVRQRALDVLFRYINPLTGGAAGEGWPFDVDLNAAPIAEMLEAIEGVERVEEVLLFEYDLRTGRRHGQGRELVHLDRRSLFLSAAHQVVVR